MTNEDILAADHKIVEQLRTLPWGLDEDINGGDLVDAVYELLANNGRLPDYSPKPDGYEDAGKPRIPCQECGPGYYIGDDGCRHTPYTGPPPGSRCIFVKTGDEVTHVRHYEPCPDGFANGTLTDIKTDKVVEVRTP